MFSGICAETSSNVLNKSPWATDASCDFPSLNRGAEAGNAIFYIGSMPHASPNCVATGCIVSRGQVVAGSARGEGGSRAAVTFK